MCLFTEQRQACPVHPAQYSSGGHSDCPLLSVGQELPSLPECVSCFLLLYLTLGCQMLNSDSSMVLQRS